MTQRNTDILNALTTIRAEKPEKRRRNYFPALLMLVFLAILLVALVTGVTIYKNVANIQLSTDEGRLGKQLIGNTVRARDGVNAVRVGVGPEGPSLVLVEYLDTGTYETRIYLINDAIVEEYTVSGTPYDASRSVKLADSSKFDLSYDSGLLTIKTDQGTTEVALRTMQGDN